MGAAVEGAELVYNILALQQLRRGYWRDEETEKYKKLIASGIEKLGIYRFREASELANATAWLMDASHCTVDSGRGTDLRALAAVAVYWIWLIEHARGLLGRPRAKDAWELVGSSRSSFYRAVRVWAKCLLGFEDHHPLLRGNARLVMFHGKLATYPNRMIVVLRDRYVPAVSGQDRLWLGRLNPVELLLLETQSTRGAKTMNPKKITITLTFDPDRLYELLTSTFGSQPFSTQEFARLLALHYPSAVQVLRKLEILGIVEHVDEGAWRVREKSTGQRM